MAERESGFSWNAVAAVGAVLAGVAAVAALFMSSPDTVIVVPSPQQPGAAGASAEVGVGAKDATAPEEMIPSRPPESDQLPVSATESTGSTEPAAPLPAAEAPASNPVSGDDGAATASATPASGRESDPFVLSPVGAGVPAAASPPLPAKSVDLPIKPTGGE